MNATRLDAPASRKIFSPFFIISNGPTELSGSRAQAAERAVDSGCIKRFAYRHINGETLLKPRLRRLECSLLNFGVSDITETRGDQGGDVLRLRDFQRLLVVLIGLMPIA